MLPATGLQGTLACLAGQWSGNQAGHAEVLRLCARLWGQSTVPCEAPAHLSQVLGVKRDSGLEWSLLFASGAAGQAEGLLLVEVAGHAG